MITITEFIWAGKWGPFRIRSHCAECSITEQRIRHLLRPFRGKATFAVKPWLDNWWYCLMRGAWHPPIIMVNGKKFHQFQRRRPLFDERKLAAHIRRLALRHA